MTVDTKIIVAVEQVELEIVDRLDCVLVYCEPNEVEELDELVEFMVFGAAVTQPDGSIAAPVCITVQVANCRPGKALANSAFFAK